MIDGVVRRVPWKDCTIFPVVRRASPFSIGFVSLAVWVGKGARKCALLEAVIFWLLKRLRYSVKEYDEKWKIEEFLSL